MFGALCCAVRPRGAAFGRVAVVSTAGSSLITELRFASLCLAGFLALVGDATVSASLSRCIGHAIRPACGGRPSFSTTVVKPLWWALLNGGREGVRVSR